MLHCVQELRVLGHYVEQGVGELDEEKLPTLLELKYGSARDAVNRLGDAQDIRNAFIGFQRHLYAARSGTA